MHVRPRTKLLSVLLSALLVVAFVPSTAFAGAPASDGSASSDTLQVSASAAEESGSIESPTDNVSSDDSAASAVDVCEGNFDESDNDDPFAALETEEFAAGGERDEGTTVQGADAATSVASASDDVVAQERKASGAEIGSGNYYLIPAGNSMLSLSSSLGLKSRGITSEQTWRLSYDSNTATISLINSQTSQVLAVNNGKLTSSSAALDDAASWYLKQIRSGVYSIVNNASGMALDVPNGKFFAGAKVSVYKPNGSVAQQWQLVDADSLIQSLDKLAASSVRYEEGSALYISSALNKSKMLDVYGGSRSNGANVQVYASNLTKGQQWKVSYDSKGYATFTNVGSGKVLDVYGGEASSGTNVQQYASNGGRGQKWIIKDAGNGCVTIFSALWPGLVLDIYGGVASNEANVQIYSDNGGANQKWQIASLTDTYNSLDVRAEQSGRVLRDGNVYLFRSSLSYVKVLDVYGGSRSNEANVQLYDSNMTKGQQWRVSYDSIGYATFTNVGSGKVLDVYGGDASSGANVQQYSSNGGRGQKWIVEDVGGGKVRISSALWPELSLDVYGGVAANETNVQIYSDNNGANQQWIPISVNPQVSACRDLGLSGRYYEIVPTQDDSFALDVTGGSTADGANVELYQRNGGLNQLFSFKFVLSEGGLGYYQIINVRSGKALDVSGGNLVPTTNILQWSADTKNANQLFSIKSNSDGSYVFVNKATGLYLDVAAASMKNGANIQGYMQASASSQHFLLKERTDLLTEGIFTITMASSTSKVVDVYASSRSEGANVQLYQSNGSLGQKWQVVKVEANTYTFQSLASGRYLTVDSSGNVCQRSKRTDGSQNWVPFIANGAYSLKNVKYGKVLDVAGGSTSNETNIQVANASGGNSQRFLLDETSVLSKGTYKILLASNTKFAVDVYGCSTSSGANVQLYSNNDSVAQKWDVIPNSDGTFSIANSHSKMALDVYGAQAKDGANVQQYSKNNSAAQKWRVIYNSDGTFRIAFAKDTSFVLTVKGSASNGSNIVISKYTGASTQKFTFETTVYVPPVPSNVLAMMNRAAGYSSGTRYLILVNRAEHLVGVFSGSRGNWTMIYHWSCVVGKPSTPTITGTYRTTGFKRPHLTTDSRAIYCTQINGGYFFHSILVSTSELGNSLSHGCVRLPYDAAYWIYTNVGAGTTVSIYN